jgi:hypothetical protein
MAIPAWQETTSAIANNTPALSVAYPTGIAAGKTLVVVVGKSFTAAFTGEPAALTSVEQAALGNLELRAYTRKLDGSESGTLDWTFAGNARAVGVALLIDATAATPLDVDLSTNGTATAADAPSVNTGGTDRLLIRAMSVQGSSGVITAPATERYNLPPDGTGTGGVRLVVATQGAAAAGATGVAAFTWTNSVPWIGYTLAIAPSGAVSAFKPWFLPQRGALIGGGIT